MEQRRNFLMALVLPVTHWKLNAPVVCGFIFKLCSGMRGKCVARGQQHLTRQSGEKCRGRFPAENREQLTVQTERRQSKEEAPQRNQFVALSALLCRWAAMSVRISTGSLWKGIGQPRGGIFYPCRFQPGREEEDQVHLKGIYISEPWKGI